MRVWLATEQQLFIIRFRKKMLDNGEAIRDIISNKTSIFLKETATPRIIIAVTCFLSMIGSAMIILTYIFFKQLRTQTRQILLHLSLMDFGVAVANFVGAVVYFDRYYYDHFNTHQNFDVRDEIGYTCKFQAAVSITCNTSSVLWTIAVAVYLHFRIVTHSGPGKEKFFFFLVIALNIFCYGVPILLLIWLTVTNRIGFAPYDSSGWCTLIVLSPDNSKDDVVGGIYGNDIWIYVAFVIIPLLYFSIRIHTKRQYSAINVDGAAKARLQIIDYKFTAIPLIFMLLRLGSVIVSILFEYISFPMDRVPNWLIYFIFYCSGIGDSAQGAANGVLFIILTKTARDLLIQTFCCRKKKQAIHDTSSSSETSPINSPDHGSNKYESEGRTLIIIQDT